MHRQARIHSRSMLLTHKRSKISM
uniref:Uncharacterized protein n=1 Tax=Arundo donax TaxID=35708 RepID=A0A0A9BIU0_ARUDO